jgi:tumor protein p53-inducible protein 3
MIKVETFAINRADILQREGKYHPPKGESSIMGLECAGYQIEEDGTINKNKRVMALLPGGGYSEYVAAKKSTLIELPEKLDFEKATAIPEAWLTAFQLCQIANIKKGDFVLVHAAASGVGTALIQLIRHYQAESICIASNEKKLTFCTNLGQGTAHGVLRKDINRENRILHLTNNQGCSVILDCVGGSEFNTNLNNAAMDCRWVCYGMLGGSKIGDLNLANLFAKRIQLNFTTLRNRSHEYKAELVKSFTNEIIPKFESEEFSPVIHTTFESAENIQEAHKIMEMDLNIGKIVLKWS